MNVRQELQLALETARRLTPEELPRLLGELEEIRVIAMTRLTTPSAAAACADELLSVPEAANRLSVSPDYLYRHHKTLPFVRRMGRRLLFSSSGLDKYIAQYGCTAVRHR